MTFIPTQTGFMRLEDSEKTVASHLPKLSQLGAVPFRATSGIRFPRAARNIERREDVSLLVTLCL